MFAKNFTEGNAFSYTRHTDDDEDWYYSFAPVFIGNTNTPWTLAVAVPEDIIMAEANKEFSFSTIVGLIGMIILVILIMVDILQMMLY